MTKEKEKKPIYFSNFIDEENIITDPPLNEIDTSYYRYSITMPFKKRNQKKEKTAVVIMKNPSKAGKYDCNNNRRLSDETIYKVTDYVYKHEENFSKVIILNLFAVYGSVFNSIHDENIYGGDNLSKNNKKIQTIIENLKNGDRVIVAWGGYPKRKGFNQNYRERIQEMKQILNCDELWCVGNLVKDGNWKFPQHGWSWFDFEKMERFEW
ncbi:DUF1643 domain-containing protein [Bacillus sp. FJAT-29814]|uniref:DUF1643 domain-containing protein n=1 Tax=Bacillus sp. FJAT-29814 TaxID=1729688 RepID=UPI0008341C17|nr:DUF1643 domain-containing protein [Bacillus sp. FJAT-29814]